MAFGVILAGVRFSRRRGRMTCSEGPSVPVVLVVYQALRGDHARAFLLDRAGTVRGSRTQSWLY